MNGTEPWDYVNEAALEVFSQPAVSTSALAGALAWWMQSAAAEAAVEFARLVNENVPDKFARASVMGAANFMNAYDAARGVMTGSYETWSAARSGTPAPNDYSQ